jgi:hypothetical protein
MKFFKYVLGTIHPRATIQVMLLKTVELWNAKTDTICSMEETLKLLDCSQ